MLFCAVVSSFEASHLVLCSVYSFCPLKCVVVTTSKAALLLYFGCLVFFGFICPVASLCAARALSHCVIYFAVNFDKSGDSSVIA